MKTKKHTHGFKVPEAYFRNFDADLFATLEAERFPETSGFVTPEDYFQKIDSRVMDAVKASEKEPKVISLWKRKSLVYAAAIAASVVLIVSIFMNTDATGFNSLQDSTVSTYIEDGNLDFSTFDVVALLDDVDITNLELPSTQFTDEKIEDYLLEDIDDTVDLIDFE